MDLKDRIWPECRSSCIVFVDGCFNASLSDLSALPASCTLHCRDETVIFSIPPSTIVSLPVQIVSVLSRPAPCISQMQILIGRHARLDVVQTTIGEGMAADHIDLMLDDGARARMADLLAPSDQAHLLHFYRASLQREARLSSFSYSEGALMLRRDWQVILDGDGAEADLKGLDDLQKSRQAHTRVCVHHRAPSSRSRQHFKIVLQGKSRSSAEGNIRIEPAAHHADAGQLCQNLLLSDEASAVMKPYLDILADDVSVKHGATFSQPGDDELFYCQSRGIEKREAIDLWRRGFCREMIDAIEIPIMRERLR